MRILLILLMSMNLLLADHNDEKELKELHIPYDMSYLLLNKQQHKQMRSILSKNRKQLKHLHEEKEALENSIKQEFNKETFDKLEFIQNSMKIKQKSIEIEADMLQSIHKILTKKQRQAFANYIEEWEDD